MLIFVAPISGGWFPSQLGPIIATQQKPDLMMGASGGNIALYLAQLSDFSLEKFKTIAPEINRKMFIQGSVVEALLRGSFKKGQGIEEFFTKNYNPDEAIEVITLASKVGSTPIERAITPAYPVCFSNFSEEKSLIKKSYQEEKILYDFDQIIHLSDTEDIARACLASASIPHIAPPEEIQGVDYLDGGMTYASPLAIFSEQLLVLNPKKFQLVYFTPYDTNNFPQIFKTTPIRYRETLLSVHYYILQDRASALRYINPKKRESHIGVNCEFMNNLMKKYKNKNYVLFVQPCKIDPEINILNFNGGDIIKNVEMAQESLCLYIWLS